MGFKQDNILGVALVGSKARGEARPDSDIDFVMIVENQSLLLDKNEWLKELGNLTSVKDENFGLVRSRRVCYGELEVEFGITTPDWLKTDPIDQGTKQVMTDGYKILDDKKGLFSKFISELKNSA